MRSSHEPTDGRRRAAGPRGSTARRMALAGGTAAATGVLLVVLTPTPGVLLAIAVVGVAVGAAGLLSLHSMRRLHAMATRSERGAFRERCLLAASRRMAQATERHEVDQVVADVARDLVDQRRSRTIVWEEQDDVWVAIASAGPSRLEVAPTSKLPDGMMERMAAGEPWVLDEAHAVELQRAYDLEPVYRAFVYLPLPRRRGPRAVLALSCPAPPDADLPDALRRFVQEVAVAEDRARLLGELAAREAELDSLLQGSTDIIAMVDEGAIVTFVNRATRAQHGYRPDDLIGTNVFDLFHPDDRGRVLRATLGGDLEVGVKVAHRMFDAAGELRHVETWVSRPAGASTGYLLNVRDVTERKELEAEIRHHAMHDALTGLANRRAFTARLDEALERFGRTGTPVGLIMLDLDDFKPVNDTWGHQAGDEVLVEIGRRLREAVRATDVAARMGGDEFAVVLEAAGEPNEVATLAARLDAAVAAPVTLERGVECRVSASLGIASSWPGCTGDELLREADQQLYVNKAARHDRDPLPPARPA